MQRPAYDGRDGHPERATVDVVFPDGVRAIPANYRMPDTLTSLSAPRLVVRGLEPEPMYGWRFDHTINGQWHANRDRIDMRDFGPDGIPV